MKKIGITTTIPVEVLFAAGIVPVDLNNIFITHRDPRNMVAAAEEDGLPRNMCSWVKGIYRAILENPDLDGVIAVTEGDCNNTLSMLDLLKTEGLEVITFSYPFNRSFRQLESNIAQLEKRFRVKRADTEFWRHRLNRIRQKALILDRMTWRENKVTGFENHLSLIQLSDMNGNPEKCEEELEKLTDEAEKRTPFENMCRIGYCGVPTVFSNLYDYLEKMGARVVFNEMQRQFAMPADAENIVEQYLNYTYPYSYQRRIADINRQAEKRKIRGVIHYVQSFCHHQIHQRSIKESIPVPVLTLEGDRPGPLMERTKIRLESFLEMLQMEAT